MSEEFDANHVVDLAMSEAHKFADRLPPDLAASQAGGLASMAWGMTRAIYQCPNCPEGTFRYEIVPDTVLACPRCGGRWVRRSDPPPLPPAQTKKRRAKKAVR